MKSIIEYLKNPFRLINPLGARGYLNWMSDEMYLKLVFRGSLNKKLNLKNPKSFNEKLQWLKLHDRKSEYSNYVDKYEVRKYIAKTIGKEYLIPLIGIYDSVEEIDWKLLPNKFILKCTHGSSTNIICTDKDKLNIEDSKIKLNNWMKRNWYWFGREWPYKNVKPRIICEKYMVDDYCLKSKENEMPSLTDYKFYCFDGNPRYCQVIKDRNTKETIDFYDKDWNYMNFTGLHRPMNPYPHTKKVYPKLEKYQCMLDIATKLSEGYPFIRVDLYLIKGRIYFGELTFYPLSGFGVFDPPEWNIKIGNLIKLPLGSCN